MKCKQCNTEAKIENTRNIIKDGKLFCRMIYVCRDAQCPNYGKEVDKQDIELEVTIEE